MIEQGITPREQIEPVTPEQALEEEFFLGLRQLDGIDLARIERESLLANGANGTRAPLRRHPPPSGFAPSLQSLLDRELDSDCLPLPRMLHLTISKSFHPR